MIKKIFGLMLIAAMFLILVTPAFAAGNYQLAVAKNMGGDPRQYFSVSLPVDSHTMTKTQWHRFGSSPYLNDNDTNPAVNYIGTPIKTQTPKYEGFFTYTNMPEPTEVEIDSGALLFFEARNVNPTDEDFFDVLDANYNYITTITVTSNDWTWYHADVTSLMQSKQQVNDFKVVLSYYSGPEKLQGMGALTTNNIIYITSSFLHVPYHIKEVTAMWGYGVVYGAPWDCPGFPYTSSYWTAYGVTDNTNIAEVGLIVNYNNWIGFGITDVIAYFTAQDGSNYHHWEISLGSSRIGRVYNWSVTEINECTWQGKFKDLGTGQEITLGTWPYANHWKGYGQSTIESFYQPTSGDNGRVINGWWNMHWRDDNGNWQEWVPDHASNYPNGSFKVLHHFGGIHGNNEWYGTVAW